MKSAAGSFKRLKFTSQGPCKEFQTTFHLMVSGPNYTMGINIIYLFYSSLRVGHKHMYAFASVPIKNLLVFLGFLYNYPKIANLIGKIKKKWQKSGTRGTHVKKSHGCQAPVAPVLTRSLLRFVVYSLNLVRSKYECQ